MDIDDWELLPVPSDRHPSSEFGLETNLSPDAIVDNHYFIIPSPGLQEAVDSLKEKNSMPEKEEDSDVRFKDTIFKKLKDDQFVDMNVESPKFSTKGTITPVIEDKREEFYEDEEQDCAAKHDIKDQWKWVVGGVRALCSIGVAAATIGIMVLAGHQQQNSDTHSQRLQFQIYTDKTRIKQATPTLTEVGGVPMTRAHVSFGGYYHGL